MEWYVFKTELIENLKIVKHIYLLFIKATVNNFFFNLLFFTSKQLLIRHNGISRQQGIHYSLTITSVIAIFKINQAIVVCPQEKSVYLGCTSLKNASNTVRSKTNLYC